MSKPHGIVDEYVGRGFKSIFLRPINPYGFASRAGASTHYSTTDWLEFYKTALDYIIELNTRGIEIREEYAALILRRLLTPYGTGYVDLQSPAGIGISAILFNHDGNVYASDESRMLAEMGDPNFRLGNLSTDSYENMMLSDALIDTITDTMTEGVPCCSDCGFQPIVEAIRSVITGSKGISWASNRRASSVSGTWLCSATSLEYWMVGRRRLAS